MDELIRKQDALDALMAERKHLLANGQKGAEHVLTHHGYNVIDELPPVQSDVPDTNVGDMISRQAAIDALDVLCQEHRYRIPGKSETYSQYNEAWQDALGRAENAIGNLPSVQPKERTEERTETHACDCISRQMLLEYIHGEPVGRLLCDKYNLDGLIEQFPSAQTERKKGHWKLQKDGNAICSECGFKMVPKEGEENETD